MPNPDSDKHWSNWNAAVQLKAAIDQRWGGTREIHIVAHSMGGLVSRQYLQNLGGCQRCQSLTTLACPHHGTLAAWCYPGKGAWQMRPGSAFLTDLEATEDRLHGIALRSYCTPMDLIIIPYTSSRWGIAENQTVYAPAHPLVLFTPRVVRQILQVTRAWNSEVRRDEMDSFCKIGQLQLRHDRRCFEVKR